ncbi:MAG: hypothetical protein ACK5JC_05245 [Bacteroidota bacterium]
MKSRFWAHAAALTASILLLTNLNAAAQKKNKKDKILEGVKFTISVSEEAVGKKPPKPAEDELYFHEMRLASEYFDDKYKFEKAGFTYSIDSTDLENKIINFNCEMENDTKDKLMWGGKVEEETIEGKIIWMKKDKVKKSYTFTGSIKRTK